MKTKDGYLKEDTWISSYPRSGNLFMVMSLYGEWGLKSWSTMGLWVVGDWYEAGSSLAATHRQEEPDKKPTIYIVRDGREVCVSLLHAINDMYRRVGRDPYFDVTLEEVVRGDAVFGHFKVGNWSEHLRAWQKRVDDLGNKGIVIRYETMLNDRREAMRQLGEFLGLVPTGNPFPSFAACQKILPERFRSGTNETWRDEMTGSDLDLFWELHGDAMGEYGYER